MSHLTVGRNSIVAARSHVVEPSFSLCLGQYHVLNGQPPCCDEGIRWFTLSFHWRKHHDENSSIHVNYLSAKKLLLLNWLAWTWRRVDENDCRQMSIWFLASMHWNDLYHHNKRGLACQEETIVSQSTILCLVLGAFSDTYWINGDSENSSSIATILDMNCYALIVEQMQGKNYNVPIPEI